MSAIKRIQIIMLSIVMLLATNIATSSADGLQEEWMPKSPGPNWLMVFQNVDKPEPHPSASLIGLAQAGYVDKSNSPGQFAFNRLRLGATGTITDKLSYFVITEFANGAVTVPTSGGGRLLYGTATYSFAPVRITVGMPVLPFGTDATAAAVMPWIDYADITKNIYLKHRLTDTTINGGTDLGMMAWQEFKIDKMSLTYFLGAFNGTGLTQNDNNTSKDIMAHLKATYGPAYVGGAYWTGKGDVSGSPLQKNKYDFNLGFGDNTALATDKIWGLVEYMHTDETQVIGDHLIADGWQAALGARLVKNTMFAYRYSTFNKKPDTGIETKTKSHSLIAQYIIPKGKGARVAVQYDFRNNNVDHTDKKAFFAQVSIPFVLPILGMK